MPIPFWCAILALSVVAQPPGVWKLVDRKDVVAGVPPNAKANCKETHATGDAGLRYSATCYSPVSRQTLVSSGHAGFQLPPNFDTLRPGQKLPVKGVVTNTGDHPTVTVACSISWNALILAKGQYYGRGGGGPCEGLLAVPGPGLRRNGDLIREATLALGLNMSSGTGVTRYLVYQWSPLASTK